MPKDKRLLYALLVVLAVTGIWAFAPSDQKIGLNVVLLTFFGSTALTSRPSVVRLIQRRPRATVALGVGLNGLAFAILFGSVFWFQQSDTTIIVPVVLFLMVWGICIALAPLSVRSQADALEVKAMALGWARGRGGLDEAIGAVRTILVELNAFARMVGPWFALFVLVPAAVSVPLIGKDKAAIGRLVASVGAWPTLLIAAGVVIICLMIAPAVAATHWARYLASGKMPGVFSVPFKPLFGYTWRYILFFGVYLRLGRDADAWLRTQLTGLHPWVGAAVVLAVNFAAVVLASPFAMMLPRVALERTSTSLLDSMRAAKQVGRSFYLGALIILAPSFMAAWAFDVLPTNNPIVSGMLLLIWPVLLFLTYLVAMTYLTRIYLRSESAAPATS